MKKTVLSLLKMGIPFFTLSFCFVLGFGLFGTVFFEVVMRVSESHAENPKTFEMAFLMSLIAFMGVALLFGMLFLQRHFETAIGMSRTRKSFFAGSLACAFATSLCGTAALYLSALTEQLRLTYWWNGFVCESRYFAAFTPMTLVFFLLAFTVLAQFIGVLFLRFGKAAFYVIWLFWMAGCFIIPRALDDLEKEQDTLFSNIGLVLKQIISGLPLFAWALIGTGVLCGFLFISYRMLLHQRTA